MKKKILSILFIFILISFLFINNNVFASSGFIVPNGVDNYIIAERYPHNDENYYVLLYSEYGSHWKVYGNAETFFTIMCYEDENFTKAVNFKRVFIRIDENDFTVPVSTEEGSNNFAIYNDVLYSTVDIYSKDGTEIFYPTDIIPAYSLLYPLQIALVSSITPLKIVIVLASIIGVGMTFVLMWFGVRKLMKIFKKALINGKISL